jgi:hypothetical protein
MTAPAESFNKTRVLVNKSVTATENEPDFPTGPNSSGRMVFAGDLTGAKIGLFTWVVTSFTGLTSIDAKIQHSDDGSTWYDVTNLAFTQATGNTSAAKQVPADTQFMRYIRVVLTVVGTGSATVKVYCHFNQCHAKGNLAPPGYIDRN